jgi:hypothetical protein
MRLIRVAQLLRDLDQCEVLLTHEVCGDLEAGLVDDRLERQTLRPQASLQGARTHPPDLGDAFNPGMADPD